MPEAADNIENLPAGAALREGALVVDEVLSQSQFAITYRGRDTRLAREVAIKEYFPLGCARRDGLVQPRASIADEFERAKTQFLDEARVLAQFRHPGIVGVFDFFAENNTTYMVMEFLAGQTLEALLQNGALPPPVAIEYILKIGQALEIVHAAAILHCDIKPENIMVCAGETERVALIDFGLTKRLDESQSYNTRRLNDAAHFGTPGYAPIEQYTHSAQIGAYTDVYALGATLYRLLTNVVPASAADRAAGAAWTPPHALNPKVGRGLSRIIEWAMQMAPAARPSSVVDWLGRLSFVEEEEQLRLAFLATLQARIRHQEYCFARESTPVFAPNRIAPPVSRPQRAEPEYLTDDSGCLHACFIGCLLFWFIGAALAFVGWGVRYLFVGG